MKQDFGKAITSWLQPLSILQRLRRFYTPSRFAILEACLMGLLAALSAIFLKLGAGWLGTWRVHTSHIWPAWLVLPTVGMSFGYLAGLLVERLAPEASSSGVLQIKTALAGSAIVLDARVAFVKQISAVMAVGSGIPLGAADEPTMHTGSALSAQISHWLAVSPSQRRQMIAAGAAVGLSATFNAPIAGVIFVVEELLQDLSGLTLGTAIIASFIGGVVSRLLGNRSLELNLELAKSSSSFSLPEIPFYLLLGILAGLFASLFNRGLIASIGVYRKLRISLSLKVALAGLISGLVVAMLPVPFRDNTGLREFVITGGVDPLIAVLAFVAQFILTLVAFGSGAPGGLFVPSLTLGSCLGYIIGVCQSYLLARGDATTYALAGMGAFLSGVVKAPMTAIVLIFESTTDFNLVLPLMISSVVAYWVAESVLSGSIYDAVLALSDNHLDGELINPFQYGNPLNSNRAYLFKGRIFFANQIVRLVLDRSRPTIVLYGPRRVGKSSFLLNLLHLLPKNILPIYLDLQSAAITTDESAFCYALVRAINRESRRLGIELPSIPKINEFRDSPYILLEEWLDKALPLLGARSILLNLDEFEKLGHAIADGRLSLQLFDELRSLIQHYEQLRFLFSGVQTLDELGPNWSSYFISVVPIEMVYLERNEAFELLINPDPQFNIQYQAGIIEEIITLTCCHPYLLQLIGASIVKQASIQHTRWVNPKLLEAAIEDALTTGEPYFMNVWTEFTGISSIEITFGQELLLTLAQGTQPTLVTGDKIIRAVLRRLQRHHVIKHTSSGYSFEVPLFERWVRERAVQD
ncbi:chloride channel protein [Tolypothrix bouteillei VB521301_2]|uniref:chloride channel protein n=1 Tax=Tolypothrix bouteillei TaxID=1246981 RepID=UPI0009E61C27